MNRLLLEDTISRCAAQMDWPVDTVRSAWSRLTAADWKRRKAITPEAVAEVMGFDQQTALRFLLAGFQVQLWQVEWQVYHPVSGWIINRAPSLGELTSEQLYDPFSRESLEPDLGSNILVVFQPHQQWEDPYASVCVTPDWQTYRQTNLAWPFWDEGQEDLPPLSFTNLAPWELGKLELTVQPGETYRVISLETRSQLTVRVEGETALPGESFILKMMSYRAVKARESGGPQSVDLTLAPEGFTLKELEADPGRLLLWIDNRSALGTTVAVWKAPVLKGPQPLVQVWNSRSVLNDSLAREVLLKDCLPEGSRIRVSGQAFVFLAMENSAPLMEEWGDREFYRFLAQEIHESSKLFSIFGGFLFHKQLDTLSFCFPDSLAAVRAAISWNQRPVESAHWKITVFAGSVLMTGGPGVSFFGYAINLGRKLLEKIQGRSLWTSLGAFSYPGVSEAFLESGYHCQQEAVSLKNADQLSLVYECRPPVEDEESAESRESADPS